MSEDREIVVRPATGMRLELTRGQTLRIIDIEGSQVADLMAVCAADPAERLSSGRTLDCNGSSVLGHGVACDLATGKARLIPQEGAPSGRAYHAAVWTGQELVIWGGSRSILGGLPLGDGARFDPPANRWSPVTAAGAPPPRHGHASVWTGEEMLILGGATKREGDALADAWAWHPDDGWRRLPDLPEPRAHAHAFSTVHGVLLIGGRDARGPRRGGYRIAPKGIERPTSKPK